MGSTLKFATRKTSMRRAAASIWIGLILFVCKTGAAQGWLAEISIQINHDLYPYERIDLYTLTYSGVTVTGQSETKGLSLMISGDDPLSGDIKLSVKGFAWEPYNPDDPPGEPVAATLTGNHKTPCTKALFENTGETPNEQVYIWIRIHPRMEISQFRQDCDQLTLSSNTCSPSFLWEVSESISGGFRAITGKSSSSIAITREELVALGFNSPYGRKYFRVTGLKNTTSQLQAIDIYYPGPSASLETSPPKCKGAPDGLIEVNIASALPSVIDDFVVTLFDESGDPLDQHYITDGNRTMLDSLHAGSYRVKIENNTHINTYGNCWAEKTFNLIDPDPVTISSAAITDYNGFQISCSEASDGAVSVVPAGGTGVYATYEWTPAVSTTEAAAGLSEGTYQVRVKDSNQCWSDAYAYSLTEPDKLTTALLSTGGRNGFDVSCHDKADGKIQTEVTGGVQPYSYSWADNHTTAVRNDLRPGSYTVTVSDANGCDASETIALIAPEPLTFFIEQIQSISCAGSYSGILEIQSVNNAMGAITASWSSGESGLQISDKSAGLYTATVRDEQGCSATMRYELKDPPVYTAQLDANSDYHGSAISCNGFEDGELTAILHDEQGNPVAGDRYAWYRNGIELNALAGQASVRGLKAGYYKVEITYRNSCEAEMARLLNEPDPVMATITTVSNYNGMPITCAGATDGHIRALATGGTGAEYNFTWSTGTLGADLENIGSGIFRVTASDINGCEITTEKTIVGPDSLKTQISVLSDYNGQPISCAGLSDARLKAIASGGTAPYNFTWSAGHTDQFLTDVAAGNYIVTTLDANGCSHVADTTLVDPLPIVASIAASSNYNGFGVSCNGASDGHLVALCSGGTGIYSYEWHASDNTRARHENLRAGCYSVIVADQNNCSDSAMATVTEPAPLLLEVSAFRNASCAAGDDGQIILRSQGGAGGHAYSLGDTWQDISVFDSLPAGTYTPIARDANNCTNTTTQVIAEPPRIEIQFDAIAPALCGDPKGTISSQISGGTGEYTLEWKNATNQTIGFDRVISDLPAGVFTLVVRDENLCEATASAGVPSSDGPAVDVLNASPASCSYTADGAALLEPRGNGPFTFRWPGENTTPGVTGLKKGQYLVEVADANGCLTVVPVTIPGPDSLFIEVMERTMPACHADCNGEIRVAARGGTGNYRYRWENSEGPVLEGICAGTYAVTVSDGKQCESATTIVLDDPNPIVTSLTSLKMPTCPQNCDARIEVHASGGTGTLNYLWSNGGTQASIGGICSGEYSVVVTDANQCVESHHFTIADPEGPSLDLGGSVMLCTGQTHLLDPGPAWTSYDWGSDHGMTSAERRLTVSRAGKYWVEVTDGAGCVARDTFLMATSDDLLNANFLLTTEAFEMDTIVAIDISWPLPSAISWTFPDEMHRLRDLGDIVYGLFHDAGVYQVTLSTTLGACRDQLTKTINIAEENETNNGSGRLGYESFVKDFTVYPNPNDGKFNVTVSFLEETPIVVTLFDLFTSRIIARFGKNGSRDYALNVDLMPLSAGAYSLRLDHRKGTEYKRLIIR